MEQALRSLGVNVVSNSLRGDKHQLLVSQAVAQVETIWVQVQDCERNSKADKAMLRLIERG